MKAALIVLAIWLVVTTVLPLATGWYRLAARYPNRIEEPLLRVRARSASIGFFHTHNLIRLSACPSGLRVSLLRLFGPFCRDFFVPWEQIAVTRTTVFWTPMAKMQFGHPPIGTLTIESYVANRLGHAVGPRWPEPGPIPELKRSDLRRRLMIQWAVGTTAGALFFTIMSIALAPNGPPIAVAILFPAFAFGLSACIEYLRERRAFR
jgi:hypothetical protein